MKMKGLFRLLVRLAPSSKFLRSMHLMKCTPTLLLFLKGNGLNAGSAYSYILEGKRLKRRIGLLLFLKGNGLNAGSAYSYC